MMDTSNWFLLYQPFCVSIKSGKLQYDKSLYKKQNEIILKTYKAIRSIRLFFANYPENRDIEIPEYLITGEKIRVY